MTTKPKAKKFRIRRTGPRPDNTAPAAPTADNSAPASPNPTDTQSDLGETRGKVADLYSAPGQPPRGGLPSRQSGNDDQLFAPSQSDDGFGEDAFPTAAAAAAKSLRPVSNADVTPAPSVDEALAKIRQEGLTGRQLRMARRVAQKHDIAATSDFDAVRLLRERGIDPFQRPASLDAAAPQPHPQPPAPTNSTNLPQTVPPNGAKSHLPSTEVRTEDTRAAEIIKMQRDIVRRRRTKLFQLATRLAFFVMLPTFLAGWYYFVIATPMYSTKSEFVIQQAQPAMGGGAGGLGSLFSGTSFATSQDSIAVQGYLGSLEAMLRLEADVGFISHFSSDEIDPLQRLEPDATKEDAHKVYRRHVQIAYDPTEGIIKLEVVAASPETAKIFAERLIFYAEEQVDNLTQRLREDQMAGARSSFDDAERNVLSAQQKVLALQEQLGVLDPVQETGALMTQITTFETQLAEKRLQRQQLLDNPRPNQARVDGVEGDIRRLQTLIGELRSQLTQTGSSSASLASISGQLRLAEADLQTRQLLLTQALQQLETARIEANRQTRYLENSVKPIAPDTPSYPRAFENTLLALLIFGGIYLMISLTASILREQVSN